MNILTHRRTGKLKINGDVRINGEKMKKDISGISAFVQQEELFVGSLTIREHLQFHVIIHSEILSIFLLLFILIVFSFSPCFVWEKNLPMMNE